MECYCDLPIRSKFTPEDLGIRSLLLNRIPGTFDTAQ